MRSLRFDTFRLDTVEKTATGGLKIQATPTRAGVLTYRRADGSQVRELRHPDEVFRPDSLATLGGAPLTDLHPATGAVTPDTWKSASIGHVGETVTHDGKLVHATVYVHDADAIQKIQSGERKDLSAGYFADTDDTSGTYDGQPYDRIQRNMVYNHLSLQPPGGGRAGPECALRIDSDDAILVDDSQTVPETAAMALRIDGKDATQEMVDALIADRDGLKGAVKIETAKIADLTKRLDAAEDPKRIAAAVTARVQLLGDIRRGNAFYLRSDADGEPDGDEAESAGADPIALMTEALLKWQPSLDLKGSPPAEIMGAFKAMMAAVGASDPAPEAPTDGPPPPKNTAPEMELNGRTRSRSDGVRRQVNAPGGEMRHDDRGFPIRGDAKTPKTAEQEQREYNEKRASAPMAASKDS